MTDTPFLGDPEAGGFLTESIPVETPVQGQISTIRKEQDLWADTGLTLEEYEGLKQSNSVAFEEIDQRSLAPADSTGLIQSLLRAGAPLEEVQGAVEKEAEVQKALMQVEDFSSVDRRLAQDPHVTAELFKIEHRSGNVRNILLDKAEEFQDGFAGSVMEFIDELAYDTYAGMRDVVSTLSGEGTEITEVSQQWAEALRTLDDEQFKEFVDERLNVLNNSLSSGSEASWRVVREIQALDAAGVILWDEEMGRLSGALGALDLAAIGTQGVKAIARAGRSTIGRLRSTAGTVASTEAATSTALVVRSGLDGEVLDPIEVIEDLRNAVPGAGPGPTPKKTSFTVRDDIEDAVILDDIVPSAQATKVRPGNMAPPVSSGSISQSVVNNMFVRQFLRRQAGFSFGTVDLTQTAENWAKQEARRMTLGSGTGLIDYDIAEEGIQQASVKFTFGRQDGKPFKDFQSASDFAKKSPNSHVVDTRTGAKVSAATKSNEYAVVIESRVPFQKTVAPLDLSEVTNKTALGRLFGSADRGSSSFFSNLADFGDYGALGYLQDFKGVLREINGLKKKERIAVDSILTTLRDTPNGGSTRSWLTTEDFVTSYKNLTGSLPSKKVIKAYEDTIQLSDFNWWVKANERLRILANQKATVVKSGDSEIFAFPTERSVRGLKDEGGTVWVWDAALQKRVSVKTLPDDSLLMAFSTKTKDGSTYVTNFAGNTRIPTLEDAFPYNAGGPRSNPDITWFIGNSEDNWATLIGARSQKDADKAVKEFNVVAEAIVRFVGPDESYIKYLTDSQKAHLTDLVKKNNSWNPNIEDIDDFIEFTSLRGVPANRPVQRRGRGEKLGSFLKVNDQSLVDLDLEAYTSYHRHDQALVEFGGEKASNPDPILAIQRQFNQMVTQGAQTQYRMNHPSAWVKAVDKAVKEGEIPVISAVNPMTDEMKVRHIKIEGNSEVARKLRQEQSVINRRLDSFEGSQSALPTELVGNTMTRGAEWAAEKLHDWHPKAGSIGRYMADNFVGQGNNKLLSLGFFQRMASFDQILLQASHFIPITAISPVNGARGMTIATVLRQAARDGDATLWSSLAKNLQVTTGLSDAEFKALTDHMFFSGRGYMKGAVAEDPTAGMGNSMLGKTKDIVSAPYYAGENYAATLSRIVAFLDTRRDFPSLDMNSRGFWNAVAERDRTLSFSLNKAQKSTVQTDSMSRVLTQWTSYPLRTVERIMFPSGLSVAERGRLLGATTILWGLSGVGLEKLATEAEENLPILGGLIANGADEAIDALLGVKVGSRLAFNPIELYERGIGTFTNPVENIPAFTLVGNTAKPVLSAVGNAFSGRWSLLSHDAETLARAWKVVDSAVMAWTMNLEDVRRTKSGSVIEKNFTPMQEVLQAIGIQPSEAVELNKTSNFLFSQKERREKASKQALPAFRLGVEAAEEGNYSKALQFIKDADAIVQAYNLSDTRLAEVREEIFNKVGFDRINWMTLQLVKEGYSKEALEFNKLLTGEQ